jgi:Dolichyl-phosphate-mannose-protein mannosyltransferase
MTSPRWAAVSRAGWPERAALGLLGCLFLTNVYRAWSQSVMMDEAFTYLSFVAPPLRQILTTYSPNHHVLYSLLARVSVHVFGLSELSLRLPGLVGGLIFYLALWRLSRTLFGPGWTMLLAISLIALSPLILDYMSLARGYSLALAFYLLGALYSVQFFARPELRRPVWLAAAGTVLGMSVAAHVGFAIPVAALSALFVVAAAGAAPELRWKVATWLVLTEIATAGAILALPLMHATRRGFAGGYDSIVDTLNNFAIRCVVHDFDGNGMWVTTRVDAWVWDWLYPTFRLVLVATLGIIVLLGAGRLWVRARHRLVSPNGVGLFCFGGSLVFIAVTLVLAHRLVGAPYPDGRMVLYCWPLLVFTMCLLMRRFRGGVAMTKCVALFYFLFCLAMVTQSALQLTLNHYAWTSFSAGTRQIADYIRARPVQPSRDVRITASSSLYQCLDFYRARYSMNDWKLDVYKPGSVGAADYLVIDVFDAPHGIPDGFRTVWRGAASGAVIAVRERPGGQVGRVD